MRSYLLLIIFFITPVFAGTVPPHCDGGDLDAICNANPQTECLDGVIAVYKGSHLDGLNGVCEFTMTPCGGNTYPPYDVTRNAGGCTCPPGSTVDSTGQCQTPCDQNSPDYHGVVRGMPVCGSCPAGSHYGQVCTGTIVITCRIVCVDDNSGPPHCQPGTIEIAKDGGGWACVPPDPGGQPPTNTPSGSTPDPGNGSGSGTDTGNSPTPINTPPDPNNPNQTPPDPAHPPARTVSGGGDCTYPPVCSGDAIDCAMLYEQWKTRCDNDQKPDLSTYSINLQNKAAAVANNANTALDATSATYTTLATNPGSSFNPTSYGTGFTSILHAFFPSSGSCSPITLQIPRRSYTITISCTYSALSKSLLGWFLNAATVIYLYQLLFRRPE